MLALTKMWLQIRLWCIISQHSSSSNTYIQNSQVIRKGDEALKEIAPRKRDISLCGYIRLGQTRTRCLLTAAFPYPLFCDSTTGKTLSREAIPKKQKHLNISTCVSAKESIKTMLSQPLAPQSLTTSGNRSLDFHNAFPLLRSTSSDLFNNRTDLIRSKFGLFSFRSFPSASKMYWAFIVHFRFFFPFIYLGTTHTWGLFLHLLGTRKQTEHGKQKS